MASNSNDRQQLITLDDETDEELIIGTGNVQDSEVSISPPIGDSSSVLDEEIITHHFFEKRHRTLSTDSEPLYQVLKRRWYILVVYWLLSFVQATLWNTWAPITSSAELAYDMTDADISLMENWNNITYIAFIFPFIWLVHMRGLRLPMVYTAGIMVVGAFVRCLLYWHSSVSQVLINIGQVLIGIAGPVAFFCCTAISATWFPPSQRTLATAVMSVAQAGGVAFSFVIGPQVVAFMVGNDTDDIPTLRYAIQRLMFGEFVAAAIVLVLVIIYCKSFLIVDVRQFLITALVPSRPSIPPCESAAQERLGLLLSIKSMCSSVNNMLIFWVYAISVGIFSGWYSLLNIAVRNVMDDIEAGWLGFWMTFAGILASLVAGYLGDRFPRHMKLQIVIMLGLAGGCFVWFTLTCNQVAGIPYERISAWTTCIIGGSFAAAIQPLCYELGNEVTFPAPEASVTGLLTGLNNLITMFYIFVQMIPNIGGEWLNWSIAITFFLCLPPLLLFKPIYNRLELDTNSANVDGTSSRPPQPDSTNNTPLHGFVA